MTKRSDIVRKVMALRRLQADGSTTESERQTAGKMADLLVAKHRITGSELTPKTIEELHDTYSTFAAAFKKAGFQPSRQAKGSL